MDWGGKGVRTGIEGNPLVGVALLLIVVFVMVTPLLQRAVPVAQAGARPASGLRRGDDAIVLSLTRDGRIWVAGSEVKSRSELAPALQEEMARRPRAPVLLRGEGDLAYRNVRDVILEMSRAGLSRVTLAAADLQGKGAP